jgi:hypothetical protein
VDGRGAGARLLPGGAWYRRASVRPFRYHQACDDIDNLSTTVLDQMSDAAAHATLTFAQSGSAIEGTGKGKSLGHGEFQGSSLRK